MVEYVLVSEGGTAKEMTICFPQCRTPEIPVYL